MRLAKLDLRPLCKHLFVGPKTKLAVQKRITYIQTYKRTSHRIKSNLYDVNIQTYKHTNVQTYKRTNVQTYKRTNIQTYQSSTKVKLSDSTTGTQRSKIKSTEVWDSRYCQSENIDNKKKTIRTTCRKYRVLQRNDTREGEGGKKNLAELVTDYKRVDRTLRPAIFKSKFDAETIRNA